MNLFKIAIRSVQHRGFGSVLTIFSMGLGVMLVVSVLTMHGVVSQQFKANSSFGYDLIIGASGSSLQVTMNTVYYLNKPVENIPYEYYLALCNKETRQREFKNSLSYKSMEVRSDATELASELAAAQSPFGGFVHLAQSAATATTNEYQVDRMGMNQSGKLYNYVGVAIPVNLGDYLGTYRVVGTKPEFFTELVLDIDTEQKFEFADGRAFEEFSDEHGYFEAVLGSTVARKLGYKVGDVINPIHGDPNLPGAHTHDQGFTIVGILAPSGTPNDRAAFVNLEGFYLMEDHAKPVNEQDDRIMSAPQASSITPVSYKPSSSTNSKARRQSLAPTPLPIEQREVTAILLRSYEPDPDEAVDEFDQGDSSGLAYGLFLESSINDGFLKGTLDWTDFRPARAMEEVQAVSPVREVTVLFENFVNPVRWVLLILTVMICVVSGISILVGIYNSMSERKHEIAVMRALGASRTRVMSITFLESITLALAGGFFGWIAGHGLNALASPYVEAQTGVQIGFWDFAPRTQVLSGVGSIFNINPDFVEWFQVSPELLLVPGLILLAVIVGVYPAVAAYRTDVARSLG